MPPLSAQFWSQRVRFLPGHWLNWGPLFFGRTQGGQAQHPGAEAEAMRVGQHQEPGVIRDPAQAMTPLLGCPANPGVAV